MRPLIEEGRKLSLALCRFSQSRCFSEALLLLLSHAIPSSCCFSEALLLLLSHAAAAASYCRYGVSYLRLDGSSNARSRFAMVQRFNSDPTIDVLLLTTHVGGLGLNLTSADTVVFLEHDWNPMKDLQASAWQERRCLACG